MLLGRAAGVVLRDLKDKLARFLINAIALEIATMRSLKFLNLSDRPSFSSDTMFSYMEARNDLRQAVADNVESLTLL